MPGPMTAEALRGLVHEHLPAEPAERVLATARPSLRLTRADGGAPVGHLGGAAALSAGQEWPRWEGKPLSVVAALDLARLPPLAGLALPPTGWLTFFYHAEEQGAWGYDPAQRDAWRVLVSDDAAGQVEPPAGAYVLDEVPLVAQQSWTLPSPQEQAVAVVAADGEQELWALEEALRELTEPAHQVGGWPDLVQNPFWLGLQLAAHGINVGTAEGYRDPRVAALTPGAGDWRLLLQVATDDEADLMWGDDGNLYFCIREQDLARGDFSRCWVELQCC